MCVKSECKYTQTKVDALEKEITLGATAKTRGLLKQITKDADLAHTRHELRLKHPELLHFTPTQTSPLWKLPLSIARLHARWLVAKTKADGNHSTGKDKRCPLCNEGHLSRIHVLTECPRTKQLRDDFLSLLKDTCPQRYRQFKRCSNRNKLGWLLASGTTHQAEPDPVRNNRIPPLISSIVYGESVDPIRGRKDPVTNWLSYCQYKDIESRLPSCIKVFTDGSAKLSMAGLGATVVFSDHERYISAPLGKGSNNMAELEAIYSSLSMILRIRIEGATRSLPIHIFTDSRYSQNILTAYSVRRKNFYLIEDIRNLATQLRYDYNMPVSIHWVPSHIENTVHGRRPIEGNVRADELAEEARIMSTETDAKNQTSYVRSQIQKGVTSLLLGIERLLSPNDEDNSNPDGPSLHRDDFDVHVDASQELLSSCDT